MVQARFFASFDKIHGVDGLVPSEDLAVHVQPALNRFVRPDFVKQAVTNLAHSNFRDRKTPATSCRLSAEVLVKITIAAAVLLDFKANWKPTDGLPAKMSNHRFRREEDRAAHVPHTAAQIDFLKVIKELFVESSKSLEELCTKHYAAAGLPIDRALRIAAPPWIFFIDEKR